MRRVLACLPVLAVACGVAVKDLLVSDRVPESKLIVIAKGSLESTGKDLFTRSRDRKVVLIADVPTVP